MPAAATPFKKKKKLTITCLPEATYEKLSDLYPKAAEGWKNSSRLLHRDVLKCIRIYCKCKGIPNTDDNIKTCKASLQLTFGETLFRKHVTGLSTHTYEYVQSISYCYVSKIFSNLWSTFKRRALIKVGKKEKPKKRKKSNVNSNRESASSSTETQSSTSILTRELVRASNGQFSSSESYVDAEEQVSFLSFIKDWIKQPETKATQPTEDAFNLIDMESESEFMEPTNHENGDEESEEL